MATLTKRALADKIIYIEYPSPSQEFGDAITGRRDYPIVRGDINENIAVILHLVLDPRHEFVFRKVRSQFMQRGKAGFYFNLCGSDTNIHGFFWNHGCVFLFRVRKGRIRVLSLATHK